LKYQLSKIDTSLLYLYITIILTFSIANWFFEIKKWQVLVRCFKEIRFRESAHQTLTSNLVGFITPAKAGDYGAKALFYESDYRKKVLFLNFVGNMYQLLATTVFGFLGLGIIAFFTSGNAIFFWGLSIFMTFVLYQMLPKVLRSLNWSLKGNAWYKIKRFWKRLSKTIKKQVRLLSFLRYVIFAHQFYFILFILGAEIDYAFAMSCIAAMYLLSSLVPVMQLLDVVVRGGVSVWVFSWFNVAEEIVLASVLVMWFCNVVLPLLPGVYFLLISRKIHIKSKAQ